MGFVDGLAERLAPRSTRRSFLTRAAVVGAALAGDPANFVLRPVSAYDAVCGSGASCSSGWTAFCVTVNHGVNTCPPGSFVAGWWKADNAAVCGGGARYYIDCNASCVHGVPGEYTCSCRCAPTTTCDQRHTCCNQFRYGQCNTQVACYGPVVCRVVSCVPPWKWERCSTAAATDNRTLSHSAPALPHSYDAIERRYVQLNGHASPLGASVGGREYPQGGITQHYQHGLLVWSPATPAVLLLALATGYSRAHGPDGPLGFPTGDERATRDGGARIAGFQHGVLTGWGTVSAYVLDGPLRATWSELADHAGPLGRPAADVVATADGAGLVGVFTDGLLMWSAATGVHQVVGAAARRYDQLDRERSYLGYPTTDTTPTPDTAGTLTTFQGGAIVTAPTTGAVDLPAAVYAYWSGDGAASGPLGYPTVPAAPVGGGAQVVGFATGIVYTGPAGTFSVVAPILPAYRANGADAGPLGVPVSDAQVVGEQVQQRFQGGTITYDQTSGTTTVS